jgi:hypothetical protein
LHFIEELVQGFCWYVILVYLLLVEFTLHFFVNYNYHHNFKVLECLAFYVLEISVISSISYLCALRTEGMELYFSKVSS